MKTVILHAEEDATYPLISVPKQHMSRESKEKRNHIFIFQINPKENLTICMNLKLSFMFSGKLFTPHQHYNAHIDQDKNKFLNIACYGNKMIYSHIKTTISRVMVDKETIVQ